MPMKIETFVASGARQPPERTHLAMLTITRASGRIEVCMPFYAATAPAALAAAEKFWSAETSKAAGSGAARTAGKTDKSAGARKQGGNVGGKAK